MRWRSTRSTSRSASLSHTDQPALFSGDTLVYRGHDYLVNNLRFTLDREPDNDVAQRMLPEYADQDPDDALVTTMAQEREMNTFFRLDSPSVIARLREDFPEIGDDPDPRTVFLKLRELRNSW